MNDITSGDYRFGPRWTEEGVVFRLWAPAAGEVSVLLREAHEYPLEQAEEGWWRSSPIKATADSDYRFRIDHGDTLVPDPASRQQRDDVHGPSVLVPPAGIGRRREKRGSRPAWPGRPWEETVFYELHVGTGGGQYGTFSSLAGQLRSLAEMGITAVELMPVADFPGRRNWGYDGVLPFAPDTSYGTPGELRALVDAAHGAGLAIWLDVVYNHFGPEGNYLHLYAPQFFNRDVHTPWGAAIDFSVPQVRHFFIENAIYWTHEMGFDGLRLDAVHAIHDTSTLHILTELAGAVRRVDDAGGREHPTHLVLENDRNQARFLGPEQNAYTAQWNDDIHHAWHVLLTGEDHGYYRGFSRDPESHLVRALTSGFVYQGETPPGSDTPRGEPSGELSPTRFIAFLQNHDQIGNRAFGERLTALTDHAALRAAVASQLLCPQIPLLFMGEPWGAETPFQFFCDFGEDLTEAVREGRRGEFGLEDLPDPAEEKTFLRSSPGDPLPTDSRSTWIAWYATLLDLRRRYLVPLLPMIRPGTAAGGGDEAVVILWEPGWIMECNLNAYARPLPKTGPASRAGRKTPTPLFDSVSAAVPQDAPKDAAREDRKKLLRMPPWSVRVSVTAETTDTSDTFIRERS
jgi:maltooligosyltrehalose trehalohydrolase